MKYINVKRTLLIITVLLIVAGLGVVGLSDQNNKKTWNDVLGQPEYTKLDMKKPLEDQVREIELAGRRFAVPLKYIDGQLEPGLEQDGLVMEYYLPDFKAMIEVSNREERQKLLTDGYKAGLLLESAAMRPPLEESIQNMRRSLIKSETKGDFDGMKHELWYRGTKEKPELYYEVYLNNDSSGKIIDWIDCNPDNKGKYPTCRHYFIDKKIKYYLHYNKKRYFSNWREQRQKTIELIDRFEILKTQRK